MTNNTFLPFTIFFLRTYRGCSKSCSGLEVIFKAADDRDGVMAFEGHIFLLIDRGNVS